MHGSPLYCVPAEETEADRLSPHGGRGGTQTQAPRHGTMCPSPPCLCLLMPRSLPRTNADGHRMMGLVRPWESRSSQGWPSMGWPQGGGAWAQTSNWSRVSLSSTRQPPNGSRWPHSPYMVKAGHLTAVDQTIQSNCIFSCRMEKTITTTTTKSWVLKNSQTL